MQSSILVQAGASLLLAVSLLLYVGSIRPRRGVHNALLGILATIALWDAGGLLAWSRPEDAAAVGWAARLAFAGACFAAPLVLYLVARMVGLPVVEERPAASLWALLLPSSVLYAALLTSDSHGLFVRAVDFALFSEPPSRWAAPGFWVLVAWTYACVAASAGLAVAGARRGDATERTRLRMLLAALLVPFAANLARVLEWLPSGLSLTYASHGVTGVLLVVAIVRFQFLDFAIPAREVIAHLHDGLLLLEPGGAIAEANAAAGRLLDAAPDALRGRPAAELLAEIAPESDAARLLARREPVVTRTLATRSGRDLEVSVGWIRGPSARPTGGFVLLADRTDQRRREQQRWRAQRLESLGVLAAGISHEVSNPLTFLRANLAHALEVLPRADALAQAPPEKVAAELAELSATLEESLQGAERITAIVEATRRLAQPPRPPGERVDVDAVVDDAIRLASLYRPDPVQVELRRGAGLPAVRIPEGELGQVVLNLVLNAKQALRGAATGRILVETEGTARGPGACAWIRVHDNGPGVAPDDREKIFDPFFTTRPPSEGMGLGLAICHQIVHVHGGSIEVGRSARLGGACFAVRLPGAAEAARVSEAPAPTPRPDGPARRAARAG